MWTWRTSHPEQASGSEGGDASHDQRPLRLQQLEGGVCHHGEAEPPQHRLLARGRLCRLLLLIPGRRLRPLATISAIGSERIERFELQVLCSAVQL